MKPLSPFLLAAGLLCGAANLGAQSPGATSLPDMVRIALAVPSAGPVAQAVADDAYAAEQRRLALKEAAQKGASDAPKASPPRSSPDILAELEQRLVDEARAKVDEKNAAGDRLAAPAMWAYRTKDGAILADAGGSFAVERWSCHLFKGRACFAGIFAGKKTVGAGVGVGLRSTAAAGSFQLVGFLAFVVPYDEPEVSFAPALGFALKF